MSFVDVVLWMVVGAALLPAHASAAREDLRTSGGAPRAVVAALWLDVVVLAFAIVAAASGAAWQGLAREDGVIEWATVGAFGAASALHLHGLWATRATAPRLEQLGRLGLAGFCLFVAGEEISWGQRLFGFKPPDAFLERNYQQELNVHNILMDESSGLGFALESKHMVAAIAVLFVVVLPLLVKVPALSSARKVAPGSWLLPAALCVLAVELSYPIELSGEGAELLLGLVLLAAVVVERVASTTRVALVLVAPLVFGFVAAPVTSRLLFGSDENGVRQSRQELSLLANDMPRAATDKLLRKTSMHKRVFTAARDEYVSFDGAGFLEGGASPARGAKEARHDRRGYFLDPWNNPYWIQWDNRKQRALLYSFGPNRLRDSNWRVSDKVRGDDIVVVWRPSNPAPADAQPDAPESENEDPDPRSDRAPDGAP